MLKIPQFRASAIKAAPTAAAGKIRRSKKLLRAVTVRLLNQRTLLDAFKTLRGANVSHTDMSTKTPAKNANRTRTSLSIMNMFIFWDFPTFYGYITDLNINLASHIICIFCENLCRTDSNIKFREILIFSVSLFVYIFHMSCHS